MSDLSLPSPELLPIRTHSKFFHEGDRKWFLKGVTYGPFKPNADGDLTATPERAREDFRLMREMGINLIRVYHVPPRWQLDLAAEFHLRVLISIPWTQHVEFLNAGSLKRQITQVIRDAVSKNKGHPAIFGYFVGNEVPATMVRWLGARRVVEFLEKLIDVARATDPRPLYSYASYPPTEYLLPSNVDFYSFNVYLERRTDFERYLARLQNLAEDKPLILGEFGLDTMRNGEDRQAEILDWHLDVVVKGGAAGTIFFSWTDEWFTGGHEIEDWEFGLVTRDRKPKKAFHRLREKLTVGAAITSKLPLSKYPKVSVIVCSYNGGKTLGDCLRALDKVRYPDFEIVLVDDGSKDDTQQIVKAWLTERGTLPEEPLKTESSTTIIDGRPLAEPKIGEPDRLPAFVSLIQPNMGLSFARNAGAYAARGEVFAYTDSDCMPDPDWLYYLIGTLISGDYAGVGGPNISPPAVNWIQAAVAAAPGGPSHVLLTDVVAEHVPGCNMAFWRWAFYGVGGFDIEYRKAGDDVDFCWRLQSSGGVVAFSPSAIVWHYRRFTLKAFRGQQEGYGEAEAMLRFKHLIFFGPTGQAKWKGQIYGAPRFTWLFDKPMIYHGVFGQGFFQSIYQPGPSALAGYLACIEWVALALFIAVLSIPFAWLRIVPYLMFLGTISVALSYMANARIEPKFDTLFARLLVGFLAFTQPIGRGWARYFTWLKFKRTPRAVISSHEVGLPREARRGGNSQLVFWNETGVGREKLLEEIFALLELEGWRYSSDTGWKTWDVQIYGNFWWSVRLTTVTEYHGGPKCLTRVDLRYQTVVTTGVVNFILLSTLLYRWFAKGSIEAWLWIPYALFVLMLGYRAWRLKARVAELVLAVAGRCGLKRVSGPNARPRPAS
jgi:glycosyltransferase involved in cell wall biosynthesis